MPVHDRRQAPAGGLDAVPEAAAMYKLIRSGAIAQKTRCDIGVDAAKLTHWLQSDCIGLHFDETEQCFEL